MTKLKMRGYNGLKREVLGIFARYDKVWFNPPTFAALVGLQPVRTAYTYLKRLQRWGLLLRKRGARGLILYRISERGRQRLDWLKRSGAR